MRAGVCMNARGSAQQVTARGAGTEHVHWFGPQHHGSAHSNRAGGRTRSGSGGERDRKSVWRSVSLVCCVGSVEKDLSAA